MPFKYYDYGCSKCEHKEEKLIEVEANASPETYPTFRCHKCDGTMHRQLSAPMTVLDDSFPGEYHRKRKGKNFTTNNK